MPSELTAIATGYLGSLALIVGPVMLTAVVAALAAVSAQGGWNVSWQPLQPKFSKLSPVNGVKRLVPTKAGLDLGARRASWRRRWRGWRGASIQPFVETAPLLSRVSLADATGSTWLTVLTLVKRALIVFATIATADYLIKRYQLRKSLKMTKQEVKEEHKMLEGNPEIKGRIRRLQRDLARRRMLAAVPKATVVITNPTHFAVALEYKRDAMAAPRVVAKGADHVAQRIKDVAREHGDPDGRERHAGPRALQSRRDRRSDPGRPVRGRGRSAGLPGPAEAAGDLRTTTMTPASRPAMHWIAPAAILAVVALMIVPMPPLLLDLLLSVDIGLAVVLLLTAIYVKEPVEFSVFPSLLLVLTLLRLSLNVAGTRLILLNGADGVDAAGHVIMAFGQFVVGGNFVVGIVVFLVLITIQFVVINHGAVRISEVTARFTLDALPGKQMAIDADLNAGLIDERAGARAARQDPPRSRLLRRHGRRHPLHPARRDGGDPHHRRQHRRRPDHRRAAARHAAGGGGPDVHHPDGGRGPGDGDSGAARLDVGRPHHHAGGVRVAPRRGSRRRSC